MTFKRYLYRKSYSPWINELSKKQSIQWLMSISMYVVVGICTATLMLFYSKDWPDYIEIYEGYGTDWWSRRSADIWILSEWLYHEPAKYFGDLIGLPAFAAIAIVLLLTIKLRYLEKIIGVMFGGAVFYVCFYLLLFEGTAIRIGFATTFVIAAFYYLKQKKFFSAFLLIIAASQVHLTSLLFLLAIPVYRYRFLTKAVYLLILVAPIFLILDWSPFMWFKDIFAEINPRYANYARERIISNQNSTGLFIWFIAFFAILLLMVRHYLSALLERDDFLRTMHTLCVLAIVSMCVLHANVAIAARIGELLLLPVVILLAYVSLEFRQQGMHFQRSALIGISLLFLVARFHYLYPEILSSLI